MKSTGRAIRGLLPVLFLVGLCTAAAGQEARKVRIGFLSWWSPQLAQHADYLREGLAELGYVDGKNLDLQVAFTSANPELTREVARRYVAMPVDVMVVSTTPAIHIAKEATQRIPIVMVPISDPIATGLAKSWSQPGGNLTGVSSVSPDLDGKRIDLLREIHPGLRTLAFLGSGKDQNTKTFVTTHETAAARMGLKLIVRLVDDAGEIDAALFGSLRAEGAEAVVVQPIFTGSQARIVPLAAASGLAVVSAYAVFAEAGALLTYGIDDAALVRRAAYFVDRILKGADPGELPIERPTRFKLTINLNTAKALGLEVPPSLLARADEVME